jgi:uncharacterized protein (UPF0548 family)
MPSLAERSPTYSPVGATRPGDKRWTQPPSGYRTYERTVRIGHGEADWAGAAGALLRWGVKERSGFTVEPDPGPAPGVGPRPSPGGADGLVERGRSYWLVAALGPFTVREPVRVVAVVEEADRCGFAYGTLQGHPVSGEEAFIVHRTPGGDVWLTLRSLTRAAPGRWRLAFPAALVAQRWYRRRYLRALRSPV